MPCDPCLSPPNADASTGRLLLAWSLLREHARLTHEDGCPLLCAWPPWVQVHLAGFDDGAGFDC